MGLKSKLLSIIGISVSGFAFFAFVSWSTLNTTKVNGPYYKQIVAGKDLIADILPPPEHIIESYFVLYQMLEETDGDRLNDLVSKSKSLREDYEMRHAFWAGNLPEGQLKNEMLGGSYQPAMEFYELRDKEVIPAIVAGNKERAAELMRRVLRPIYERHRASIDNVVKMSDEILKQDEATVAEIIKNRSLFLSGLALGIISATIALGWIYICRGIIGPLRRVVSVLADSAEQVTVTSEQVTSTSQGFAERASGQAAAIEETSAALEETASMIMQNADYAREARELMKKANHIVDQACASMTTLNRSMEDIRKAGEETSKIVRTIDEIAFQTNLLALNTSHCGMYEELD